MVATYLEVARARVVLLEERQRLARLAEARRTWPTWEPVFEASTAFSRLLGGESTQQQRDEAQDALYTAQRAWHLAAVAYKRAELRAEQLDLDLLEARHALVLAERARWGLWEVVP